MGVRFESDSVYFEGIVHEDAVTPLRDYLQQSAPQSVRFDFATCDDIHLAVLQAVMTYRKLYMCDFAFGNEVKIYQKVLEGFELGENHCH